MRGASDSELMELYAGGNAEAFEDLFRRYERRVYGYFMVRARCDATASDLYQELFLRLHRFRHLYDPGRPFGPWLFRVAERVWLDELRRRGRLEETPLDDREPASTASAERRAIARGEARRLLAALSDEQGRVVVAAKLGGAEYAEIASELGKSVEAAKQIGARALRKLRRMPAEAC